MDRKSANQINGSNTPPHVASFNGDHPGNIRILPQSRDVR